jgi:transcriptional regulator with XRE-family HTH domain
MRTIGERIRHQRQLRRLSVRQAAELAGIVPSTLSRIERGERSADNRIILANIARALQCSVATLTGQPGTPTDPASSSVDASVHEILQALLDTDLDLTPSVTGPRPIEEVAADVDHALRLATIEARYVDATRRLPQLLREAHAHTHGPRRSEALRALSLAARVAMICLKNLGYAAQAWVAAERSQDAATALGDPVLRGLAAWTRAIAASTCGAYSRATAITHAGIETLRDSDDPLALPVRGQLHLLAGWSELLLGNPDGGALIDQATALARDAGETWAEGRDPLCLFFGPTNVGLWRISAATDAGEAGRAVEIARSVSPEAIPASRQTTLYMDLARALAGTGDDAGATRMLVQAERLGRERVHHSPLVAETVRVLVQRRRRTDPPVLTGLAERLQVP